MLSNDPGFIGVGQRTADLQCLAIDRKVQNDGKPIRKLIRWDAGDPRLSEVTQEGEVDKFHGHAFAYTIDLVCLSGVVFGFFAQNQIDPRAEDNGSKKRRL